MKAIILISSIFYILGLKISNKIDIVKKANPIEKIITNSLVPVKPAKAIVFKDEAHKNAESDSLKSGNKNHQQNAEKNK
jgi:transcription antitermination factor NusA-like protein